MVIIDGDVLVYRFAHSEQRVTQWDRDLWTMWADMAPARAHVAQFIDEIRGATGERDYRIVLSDLDANFRKELPFIQYKANRAGVVRPILWKPLRLWLEAEHGAVWEPRLEGDDLCGLLAQPGDVIATIDKDLATVPGMHYNWDRGCAGVGRITPDQARRFFLTQVLTGDKTDGYAGVPGLGPVRAKRLLDEEGATWATVSKAFTDAGMGAGVALDTARAAWILRGNDYNFTTKQLRLWTPEVLEEM